MAWFTMITIVAVLFSSACIVQTEAVEGETGPPGLPGETGSQGEPGMPDPAAIAGLQSQVDALQAKLDALEKATSDPDCPPGYSKIPSTATVCSKGSDEIVKVGTGGAGFWIDRYEASLWDNQDGTGTQYGVGPDDYPPTFPQNGQAASIGAFLYAVSRKGVLPSSHLTWFQANLACAAVGKRLPTGAEWLLAATGTNDPGPNSGVNGACMTIGMAKRETGAPNADSACSSVWGAQDMVGNLREWTVDWFAARSAASLIDTGGVWPDGYGNDEAWSIEPDSACVLGGCAQVEGLPTVAARGGGYDNGEGAGVFYIQLTYAPTAKGNNIGVRCVRPQ